MMRTGQIGGGLAVAVDLWIIRRMPSESRPPAPYPRHVHVLGICGRMAGGLAMALRKRGVQVTGTDDRQFPPMPEHILAAGIPLSDSWQASNLPPDTGVVVTSGLVGPDNPEWQAAAERGIPVLSAAAFLESFALPSTRNTVVAGTKGKSTTTAMLAWILEKSSHPADHLIGGPIRGGNWPLLRLDGNPDFVLEGDEYPCGPDDPTPKLARYRARHLVVTNISHDHPDVFPDFEEYREIFLRAVRSLPEGGRLIFNADDPGTAALAEEARCRVLSAGFSPGSTHRLTDFQPIPGGSRFCLNRLPVRLAVPGAMNAINAALALLAARELGVKEETAALALAEFPGVAGRLEPFCRFGDSVFYTEDTSHPLAVRAAVETLRQSHPGRRLLAIVFPGCTGGRGGPVQRELPSSLGGVDCVLRLPVIEVPEPTGGAFDSERFQRDVQALGPEVLSANTLPEMIATAVDWHRDGDIIVGFKGHGPTIPWDRLAAALRAKNPRT